tara:strand:+ start:321 stop:557 length:237 start_codon:yes stop_codon:yes gene_type:complete
MDGENYKCPKCSGSLIWSIGLGKKSRVVCSNNPAATRVDFILRNQSFCHWKGYVKRQQGGKVVFFDEDGYTMLRRFLC